jgi:porin
VVLLGALRVLGAEEVAEQEPTTPAPAAAKAVGAAKPPFVPVHVQIQAEPQKKPKKTRRVEIQVPVHERPFHILQPTIPLVPLPTPTPAERLARPDRILGTWDGLLPALEHEGIRPSLTFVSDLATNPVGGVRHGFAELDNTGFGFTADMERLFGLTGGRFDLSMNLRSGSALSTVYLDNLFNTQQVAGGTVYRLINVDYDQSLCEERVDVRVGRIAAGDEFLSSPYYWLFVQNGIDGNPVGIFFNTPGITAYPTETWGLRIKVHPIRDTYVMTGFYNGDPNMSQNDRHGVDFTIHGPLFFIVEAGYTPNSGKGEEGLPGHYKVGFYYNGGPFTEFAPAGVAAPTVQGDVGFYFLADQIVFRRGTTNRRQEIGWFASLVVAPDPTINTMPIFMNGGLLFRGLLPSRPRDYLGLAMIFGDISPEKQAAQMQDPGSPVQRSETVFEWTYNIHVAPGFQVQPDLQYIIDPGQAHHIPNALVLGVQVGFNF